MFNFLPLVNNSVTIGWSFFVTNQISNLIIKYEQYFAFLLRLYSSVYAQILSILLQNLIKALGSLQCVEPTLSRLLINNWYLALYGSSAYK